MRWWWNWYTRMSQKHVPQGLRVQVPPVAPNFFIIVGIIMPVKVNIIEDVDNNIFCDYGCKNVAKYMNNSGKNMCCRSPNSCPENKKNNSEKLKLSYKNGTRKSAKDVYMRLTDASKKKMIWNKGLTKKNDKRMKVISEKIKGQRKISDKEKLKKVVFKEMCQFEFSNVFIQKVKGYELLKKFGMFHRNKNRGGVVRDHRFSIHEAFIRMVDPQIVKHPANCRFLLMSDNARKTFKSEITYEKLLEEISDWNKSEC